MIKGIILDFDGLIIDTEVIWYEIFKDWFSKEKGYDLSIEEFLACVGADSNALFKLLKEKHGIEVDAELFANQTRDEFILRSEQLPAKDGVVDFIKDVKNSGLKLSLATSSGRLKPTKHLTRLGLLEYFDNMSTADDVEKIKPEPDLFLHAIFKMGLEPSEVIIFEDSLNGLIAGKNAGIGVIVVPNGVTKYCDFNGEICKIESFKDISVQILKDKLSGGC